MTQLSKYQAMVAQEVEATGDLSVEFEGGASSKPIQAGDYLGYVFHYADIGDQADEFQGELKGYVPNFKVGVALFDWSEEKEDFELVKLHYEFFPIAIKQGSRAKFMKMMNAFKRAGEEVKHFAGYFLKPKLFSVGLSKDGKYNNIDFTTVKDGVDQRTKKPIELPMIDEEKLCMFLWNNPDVEEFNKLNDWTKNEIINAHNFNGSAVEFMITQEGSEAILPKEKAEDPEVPEADEAPEEKPKASKPQVSKPQVSKPTVTKAKPKVTRPTLTPTSADDVEDDVPFAVDEE